MQSNTCLQTQKNNWSERKQKIVHALNKETEHADVYVDKANFAKDQELLVLNQLFTIKYASFF